MGKRLSNLFILLFALIGSGVALWLTIKHFKPDLDLGCSAVGGCEGALKSKYGQVGPVPTAMFGLAMYLALIGLCLQRLRLLKEWGAAEAARAAAYATSAAEPPPPSPDIESEETPPAPSGPTPGEMALASATTRAHALRAQVNRLDMGVFGIALLGAGISWWLQYIALYQVNSFCQWCMGSAVLVTLIALLAARDYLIDGRALNGEQKMLAAILSFVGILSLFILVPTIQTRIAIVTTKPPNPTPEAVPDPDIRQLIVRPDMMIKGDPKAPYLLVEFADYMCPSCKRAVEEVEGILKTNKKIRLAFRNYPLPIETHLWNEEAACAALAAGKQGKFWEMHHLIFERQEQMELPTFSPSQFDDFAAELGLDTTRFKKDRESDDLKYRVQKDHDDGKQGGVTMTPTFFIVTDKKIWRFPGIDKVKAALENPDHEVWSDKPSAPPPAGGQ